MKNPLVDPEWLSSRLSDPSLIIADCRSSDQYAQSHIPGAISWDTYLKYHWADTSPQGMEQFVRLMEYTIGTLGIGNERTVVVYEEVSEYRAVRALWLLHWLGHNATFLLDGGLKAWEAAGLPTSQEPRRLAPVSFRANPRPEHVAVFKDLLPQERKPETFVLDTRSPVEYSGENRRATRGGHVPGAVNFDYVNNLDEAGRFKPISELKELYENIKVKPSSEVITYCHGGYRSAHTWLALQLIGHEKVRSYLGSWQEWGDRIDLPIEQ